MSKPPKFCPHCAQPLAPRHEGGLQRLACHAAGCSYVHWDNPTPVVAAIVEHEGKIILASNAAWPTKFFALITGFLERNEHPEAGVLREVEEELGLKAHTPTLVGHYNFERMNQLIIAYHVRAEGTVKLSEELSDWRAIEPARLRPWPAATGLALRDWMISRGYTPPSQDEALKEIREFLQLTPTLATAGQPRPDQLMALRAAGYEAVINLALRDSPGAVANEEQICAQLGLAYTHIPVDFKNPEAGDLDAFFARMDEHQGRKLFVHCIANKRVSAFIFLYRVLRLGWSPDAARADLARIWEPDPVWSAFLQARLQNR